MAVYARFAASDLPKAVGLDLGDGRRQADGRAGHLCHGPYITLSPGLYTAGFYIQRDPEDTEGILELDACAEHGGRIFASRSVRLREMFASLPGLTPLDFAVDAVERGCEIRLHAPARARLIVTEAVLFRREVAARVRR